MRPAPIPVAARIHVRIRFSDGFSDGDPAGIAFFGACFTLANAAIEAFFETGLGVDFHHLHAVRRAGTGYAHAEADWFAPGRMGGHLVFTPLVTHIGRASCATTLHAHQEGMGLARIRFVSTATDLDPAKPIPIPKDLRAALARCAAACESLAL